MSTEALAIIAANKAAQEKYSMGREIGTVTIASGQTVSNMIDMHENTLAAVGIPAAFTGTGIQVQSAPTSEGTYQYLSVDGTTNAELTVSASKNVPFNANHTQHARFVKLVSNAAEGAERIITVYAKHNAV